MLSLLLFLTCCCSKKHDTQPQRLPPGPFTYVFKQNRLVSVWEAAHMAEASFASTSMALINATQRRGINSVVFHGTFSVIFRGSYDTYASAADADALGNKLDAYPTGTVAAMHGRRTLPVFNPKGECPCVINAASCDACLFSRENTTTTL